MGEGIIKRVSDEKENWFLKLIYKPNPWILRIVSALLVFVITSVISVLYSLFTGVPWINVLKNIMNFVILILVFKIPVWILIISNIVVIVVTIFISIRRVKKKIQKIEPPGWLDYTYDQVDEWWFRWTYIHMIHNGIEKWEIGKIISVCALCNSDLVEYIYQIDPIDEFCLKCPKPDCGKEYPYLSEASLIKIKQEIDYRQMYGGYKKRPLYQQFKK